MSFREDLVTILSGGLPALLDGANVSTELQPYGGAEGSVVDPRRVEEIAPGGGYRDSEPFLSGISQNQVMVGAAAVLGVIALFMVVKR